MDGNVFIWSPTAGEVPDIIFLSCELDRVRITSDEVDEIWEMIPDRYNWGKLEKKYRRLVEWLRKSMNLCSLWLTRMYNEFSPAALASSSNPLDAES